MAACLAEIEKRCMAKFISSTHYAYVLSLKAKELTHLAMGHFKVVRLLGEGGFGQVLEVVKRDCGKHYAMKVMKKQKIASVLGGEWEDLVLIERRLLSKLHHPLLINLAYAFQNVSYLLLVMDACPGGDLSLFGVKGPETLTPAQVKFVGLEVTAVVLFLHAQLVMFRDLKPSNLLLDDSGHVRLIDFGIAEQGDEEAGVSPTSRVECGSGVYVAPEVRAASEPPYTEYGVACDWFSMGTMMYELTEKSYPFGDDPKFESLEEEFIQPVLLAHDGESEIPHLYEFLAGLLDWDPKERLGGVTLRSHPYFEAADGQPADWELVEQRRLPSPLRHFVRRQISRMAAKEKAANEREQGWHQRRMSHTASKMAKDLSNAAAEQAKVDGMDLERGEGNASRASEALADLESEMRVEDWEFSSAHAISREYLDSQHDVVSVL